MIVILVTLDTILGSEMRVEKEYLATTPLLMEKARGMISSELGRKGMLPSKYLIISRWTDLKTYEVWEAHPEHRRLAGSVIRFADGFSVEAFTRVDVGNDGG